MLTSGAVKTYSFTIPEGLTAEGIAGILAGLISGSLFVEIIFSYPGIGKLLYDAALRQDYYLVIANMVIGNALILVGILISDILLAVADPRVRIK